MFDKNCLAYGLILSHTGYYVPLTSTLMKQSDLT